MEIFAVVMSIITLLAVAAIFLKMNQAQAPQNDQATQLLQQQIEGIRASIAQSYKDNQDILQKVNTDLTQTLQTVDKNVNSRLDNAAKVISAVHQKLGEVHETTRNVQEISKDIASLQDILKAPKLRGGMGELFLGDLLSQILPPDRYTLQYKFGNGEVVDSVIVFKDGLVPIDSKFPLESFKRMIDAKDDAEKQREKKEFVRRIKKHIDDIEKKYIRPDEGTFNFALMYLPAENVYYETIIKDDNFGEEKGIFHYAMGKKVLPVSPNSFYAYLQTILMGLRGMKIEQQAQEILKTLSRLEGDFNRITEDFQRVGTHLKNMSNAYDDTGKRLDKFGNKLESLENKDVIIPAIEEKVV
ncbi:MAG: DNA recombination protein RmuC [Candidatus Margulisbacteria bacterium]|nr:DNA recombination protein RmuC [Candidatus Margulisiibacteriota bacterium]